MTADDMTSASKPKPSRRPKPSRAKVREHRDRLRSQGLRPIQIWVPDMRAPAFRAQAHRQSLAVRASARAREDQTFIDAVSDRGDHRCHCSGRDFSPKMTARIVALLRIGIEVLQNT
jgi:hypothetical protein